MVALVLRATCVCRTRAWKEVGMETGSEHEHRFWLQCCSHCLDCVLLKEDLDELPGVGCSQRPPAGSVALGVLVCSSASPGSNFWGLFGATSGACLLELLHHLVLQDCVTYPLLALTLTESPPD